MAYPDLELDVVRRIARATGMLLWVWVDPPHGRFRYRDNAMLRLLGHDERVVAEGVECYDAIAVGDGLARIRDAIDRMLAGDEGVEVEFALRDVHGRTRWFIASGARATAPDGQVIVGGWTHEITARKELEASLAESRATLALAERLAGIGAWHFDLATATITWSEGTHRMFGTVPADGPPAYARYLAALDPDERPQLEANVARCATTGAEYTMAHWLTGADGVRRRVMAIAGPDRDREGRITGVRGIGFDITALVSADEARRLSEQRLQLSMAASEDGTWEFDPATHAAQYSARWYAILGLDPAAHPATLALWRDRVHPDDRARVVDAFDAHLADPVAATIVEYRLRRADGSWAFVRDRFRALRGADGRIVRVHGILTDFTERRAVEERLTIISSAIEHANDAVAVLEVDHDSEPLPFAVHRFVNPCCARLLGYEPGELTGQRTRMLFGPETDLASMQALQRALGTGAPLTEEFVLHRADGSPVRVDARLVPIAGTGPRPRLWVITLRDVTEARRREATLVALKEAAESAAQAKSLFLANMSHELRTPMNGILGMLELLLAAPLDGRHAGWAHAAHDSAQGLLALLDDILDLSKVEAGKMELHPAPFDPAALVRGACELLGRLAVERGLSLVVDLPDAPLPALVGDGGRLRQVLLNLVGNALKFTEAGAVTVVVRGEDAAAGRCTLVLEVRDTGIGIPDALRARLFEPFAQGDASATRRFGGTGLGLAISRELVVRMGGTIDVESVPGAGSRFTVRVELPVAEGPLPAVAPATAREAVAARAARLAPALAGRRVLVVEDNAVNRAVVLGLLDGLGLALDEAADGVDGLAALGRSDYDLVLVDHHMPRLDGMALVAALRARVPHAGWRRPAIVMMTANAMRGDRERYLAAGCDDYVAKPVSRAALLDVVERALLGAPAEATPPAPAPHAAGRDRDVDVPLVVTLRGHVHAIANAAQAQDDGELRHQVVALSLLARRQRDEALVRACETLAHAPPPLDDEDWEATVGRVQRVIGAARALQAVLEAAARAGDGARSGAPAPS